MTGSTSYPLVVLGEEDDPHISAALDHLKSSATHVSLERMVRDGWAITGSGGRRTLTIGATDISFGARHVVWLRKFDVFRFARHLSGWEHGWAVEEWRATVDGLVSMFEGCDFVDDPRDVLCAESKVRQLLQAESAGFDVPEWYVGADASRLPPDPLVMKRLSSRRVSLPPMMQPLTGRFPSHLAHTSEFDLGVNFVQRLIAGGQETRVVVAGDSVSAFVTERDGYIDVREQYDAHIWSAVELPAEEVLRILGLARTFSLTFCTMDFIREEHGTLWFLEINPRGNYLWLEESCGVAISSIVASVLDDRVQAQTRCPLPIDSPN